MAFEDFWSAANNYGAYDIAMGHYTSFLYGLWTDWGKTVCKGQRASGDVFGNGGTVASVYEWRTYGGAYLFKYYALGW